jgi:hypothetical protein
MCRFISPPIVFCVPADDSLSYPVPRNFYVLSRCLALLQPTAALSRFTAPLLYIVLRSLTTCSPFPSFSSLPLNSGQDFLPSPANVQTAASLRATAASVASETTGARVGSITYEAKEEGSSPRTRKEGSVSASPRTRKEAELLNRERSRSKDGTMGETRIVVSAAQESAAERVASFLQSETASPQTNFRVDDKDMNNSRSWGGGGH